jgi:uncharacterized protein YgiM (DUF1202 family)
MIRLTLLLCAALILAFHFGGQDHGQQRLGLIAAKDAAEITPTKAVTAPALAETTPGLMPPAAPLLQGTASLAPTVQPVVFSPEKPLIAARKPQIDPPVAEQPVAVKYVKGRVVNIRSGPSTQDAVVGKLNRGEAVAVIWVEDNGWARVRIEGDGIDGFVSADFLTDQTN